MATRLHVGAKELKGDIGAYAKRFDLLELRGLDAANLKLAPNAATLRRWRKGVPPSFEFSVVAGPNVGKAKPSEAFDVELAALKETATTLQARVVVVATPADVTPSKLWRDRLAKVWDALPRDATTVVWEPAGLWELEDAAEQAARWGGVVVAVDPARDEVPAGPVAYGRLRALGGTRAYSTAALARVAEAIGERRDAYVVFETAGALKEAKTLRGLVRQGGGTKGGLGRLLRPRGGVLVPSGEEE